MNKTPKGIKTKKRSLAWILGFTLIELLIVFSVISILSIVGIASFVSYSRSEALNSATMEVYTMLNTAKSRALSQVKPSEGSCATDPQNPQSSPPLESYKVSISSQRTYKLDAVCGSNTLSIDEKKLPSEITFSTSETMTFHIISGSVDGAGTVTINAFGKSKNIVVDSYGNISIN